ncbi:hypothetical protein YC2023_121290 [Brassica napus]
MAVLIFYTPSIFLMIPLMTPLFQNISHSPLYIKSILETGIKHRNSHPCFRHPQWLILQT